MTEATGGRWRPSRAGILNVYQYEDETLHFAGGRLLLRGVNGSGKSTAMNMLLPFLLEADTRRIDAAGEQTGVLKSWMLADNDETQRTGYLWIEFSRPDAEVPGGVRHHTVGCGIRANRSTDRASTWWFSTPRRARIDFALTNGRVPLAVDALRAELGPEAVFTQVTDYRAEVARQFFGGAEPSGYFALLHQVRNPRVGDRIDADLPRRLLEALPPVPEDAVADAAQPLEDLEGHRRNVLALSQTDRALASVLETYRNYARRVLRGADERAAAAVTAARSALQQRGRLRGASEAAAATESRLRAEVGELERGLAGAESTLTGLLNSDAYKQLAALIARREQVASLESEAGRAERARDEAGRRARDAVESVRSLRGRVDADLAAVADDLAAAARHGRAAGVTVALPEPPVLRVQIHAGGVEGPGPDADPVGHVTTTAVANAVRARRADVARVRGLLAESERSSEAASRANTLARDAEQAAEDTRLAAAEARAAADEADTEHRRAVAAWGGRLAEHVRVVPPIQPGGSGSWLAVPAIEDPGGAEVRELARLRVASATAAVTEAEGALEPALAEASVRLARAGDQVAALDRELREVRETQELPLPRPAWQHGDPPDAVLFASLVDFLPGLDDTTRAGIEAACEAAGLLTATVRTDGTVVATGGELLLGPGSPVEPNLASVLGAMPADGVDPASVAAALTRIGLGATSAAALWVAEDGRFGAGPLRGRHGKPTAELIGAGARAAARRRRIEVLEEQRAAADGERAAHQHVHDALVDWRRALRRLGAEIPGTSAVDDFAAAAVGAVRDAQRAAERASAARARAVLAEQEAERAWALAETGAAEAGLRLEADALDEVAAALGETDLLLRRIPDRVDAARRSLGDWAAAVAAWAAEVAALEAAQEQAVGIRDRARAARTELSATEAALGEEPEQVAEQVEEARAHRNGLAEDLKARRAAYTEAVGAAATARTAAAGAEHEVARAEQECRQERAALLAVTRVPGLLPAARADDAEELPDLPDTVEGTAQLVAAVRAAVPEPQRAVDEDALDRSLRAVRDSLGAGWDAGSRRSGDGAPVAVEVSGPYGRRALLAATEQVAADLRRARGLLTAQQDQALRNLLHGRVAREVARALFDARELVTGMNDVLRGVTTSQGIGVRLDWRHRGDLDPDTATALRLMAKDPDARSDEEDTAVRTAVSSLVEDARAADPEASYRDVIARVLDYRSWHELKVYLRRPGRPDELLSRRSRLSEGEKKLVTYLPMAAAASASATAHDPHGVGAPRLILLDDAFAKVSEDNHERLFGLLVGLDLDFVVTSERLFGTHASVPELAITEVLRDADLRTIALVHYHWDGRRRTELASA
ncbi:MAG: TIGR02680 family protein [Pseudonocardia sp.]